MTDYSTRPRASAPQPRADDDPTTRGGYRWRYTIGPAGFAVWETEVYANATNVLTGATAATPITARVEVTEARDNLYPGNRGLAYLARVAEWFTEGPFATLEAAQDAAIRAACRVTVATGTDGTVRALNAAPEAPATGDTPEGLAEMRARIGAELRRRLNVAIRGAVLRYVGGADGCTSTAQPRPVVLARVRASLPSGRFRVTGPDRH